MSDKREIKVIRRRMVIVVQRDVDYTLRRTKTSLIRQLKRQTVEVRREVVDELSRKLLLDATCEV